MNYHVLNVGTFAIFYFIAYNIYNSKTFKNNLLCLTFLQLDLVRIVAMFKFYFAIRHISNKFKNCTLSLCSLRIIKSSLHTTNQNKFTWPIFSNQPHKVRMLILFIIRKLSIINLYYISISDG